ncbi:heme utilization cystosolic carrier protein HutX [Haemophilus parahaemolyticus]|uniref:Heme utilization cystosolic carrier protein HutX n=1 Tax=Haemophilus parahaemolyticus TaxID=735 RepID=A0A369ZCP2_HAEPH|nr:heme utilization cystosolic carrier protein HutX [Haemophilus parahaemolyticus]MDQ6575940.1 heme utilization cystosolic carrier protein HutX [Haemophilus parahaemolyticus]RDE82956.1 heme utilization cystosolic carrier protein HutX [Haemophilus parahaemolyticus]RDF04027.1 heme utilization cystosolic carrier protein HutX [Haemophilus parahaemolyticus]
MTNLTEKITAYIAENPQAITLDMAAHFELPEGKILVALPEQFVRVFEANRAEEIFAQIAQWGTFTTIIEKCGSIFEIKDRFPEGIVGRGYYNLNMKGDQGALHGHLKLDGIAQIAFVNLPFRGKESYNIAFIAHNGETIFKVYLGRDEQRQLFPEQVEKFNAFQ